MNYLSNFSHIYVEEEIMDNIYTKEILNKFPNSKVIKIKHYKDSFSRYSQNFRTQKNSQKLILAKKEKPFLYPVSDLIQKQGYENFYYATTMLNCIYDCHYCFLQGMYPSANVVLFVNIEDFFEEVKDKLKEVGDEKLFVSISYDTDVLAVENLFGMAKKWIDFAKNYENLVIEIRTKSVNLDSILDELNENILLSFSLSPDVVANRYEIKTPNLEKRVNAIKKVISKGYKPSIAIDPILKVENYEKVYNEFIEYIFQEINPKDLESIIFGVMRMNSSQYKSIKKSGLISDILYYPYETKNGVMTYSNKIEIINFIENKLLQYHENIFYV
jgi:spore photoproduct lyase